MNKPFDVVNPELALMREDVAKRLFCISAVETIVKIATAGLLVAGLFALSAGGAAALGLSGATIFPLVLAAGGALASFATMKERKRLEIDEEFLQSRMQGRNWWGGYRQEVMEQGKGEAPQAAAMFAGIPSQAAGKDRGK